ncbi:glycoside hydrolase family 16 protein [Algibacter amylolyticus]|uniref:Glycoside hydrolase family 16 protein n=1 Tax=Algibacter amylolyticus TaxID=1608400 RepID=A0A5M7BJ01_9FLAO|nr:glycoside hydrolase family 16 protein [Algibacter amylolyticus]KAA5827451.1 glycoside hydrolase family 16 protein [Algibacter amylolyticus]MBB5266646.1 beta-glucanase (GH16 family) [Algibacter amylolyticus]TSJ81696.1 glycoside hydrolase family 16 protein [Algibacter amylolyticus]
MYRIASVIILFSILVSCNNDITNLIWEENFDGNSLNENNWNFELGNGCPNLCGWGNNEMQLYTKNNHEVKDGLLTIKAKLKDSVYTSTRITTKNKFEFKYGKIEARAKLPVGKGLWPAFWMLGSNIDKVGWPKCGEIDILEYVGKEPGMVFTSLHTQDSHGDTINTKKSKIESIEEGFHVYAVNWTEDKIEFFIDNQLFYTFIPKSVKDDNIWPFNQRFYVIVNLAIGGNYGGPEVDNTIFPQEFIIDYIKVYSN